MPAGSGTRIAYLDSLRGLAAVVVSCGFHLQNLAAPIQPEGPSLPDFSLYRGVLARLVLKAGGTAVDLFFIISGIVFAYVYLERIRQRRISGSEFFLLRLSRLYPIHLATLLVTAILVRIFFVHFGRFPIYPANDAKSFLLNLAFLQRGFFDHGYSFNGPAWSLSIEAFLYLAFYALARYSRGTLVFLVPLAIGVAIYGADLQAMFFFNEDIARGLVGFFVGVLLYHFLFEARAYLPLTLVCGGLAVGLAIVVGLRGTHRVLYPASWVLFVLVLLAIERFALLQSALTIRPLTLIGDASLSIYLVHVPLQIALLLGFGLAGVTLPLGQLWFVGAYTTAVIALGLLVHVSFERPARTALRRALLERGQVAVSGA